MSLNYKEDGELKSLVKTGVVSSEPIGMIISFMGKNAPTGYLICDGSEYNIADYEKLANHFENEFGTVNYFGGNGTTTFKVPDLRGEFLRGTGTNSHAKQGNGAAVGQHQDGTVQIFPSQWSGSTTTSWNIQYPYTGSNLGKSALNIDSIYTATVGTQWVDGKSYDDGNKSPCYGTSRPTNTSVLYCIKYD